MQQRKGVDQAYARQPQPSYVPPPYGPAHEVPAIVHYITLILVVLSLGFSAWSFMKISEIQSAAVPKTVSAADFLVKLTSHEEAMAYTGTSPLNILQISQGNLGNLQSQIAGLDVSYIGSYLIQYADSLIIYDYENDIVKGKISLQQPDQASLANEFAAKLYAHPEMAGLSSEQPQGGQLDEATLSTLRQQFPEVYAPAKVGDFLLRYSSKLVIYDYANDRIVNVVELQ